MTTVACMKGNSINAEQEKTAILSLLKELDSWYKEDRFLIQKALLPQPEWVVTWLGLNNSGITFEPTEQNIRDLSGRKLEELGKRDLCTEQYLSVLQKRIESEEAASPGILLTDHQWGDNLSGLMAETIHLDYLPMFDAEGYNPVVMENENLSPREIDEWHKHRINVKDGNTASYILMYPEIGLGIEERQFAFFTIRFKKIGQTWKTDGITIKEDSRKNILAFYEKSEAFRKK